MNLPEKKKQPKNRKKPKQKNKEEALFQKEWERVQNLQKKNQKIREILQSAFDTVSVEVRDSEYERQVLTKQLCEKLIPFVSKKTLPDYLREELMDWVQSLIYGLSANPFVNDVNLDVLGERMEQELSQLDANEKEKHERKLLKKGFTQEQIDEMNEFTQKMDEAIAAKARGEDGDIPPEIEDLFEDLFGEFDLEEGENPFDIPDDDSFYGEQEHMYDEQMKFAEQEKNTQNELNQLLKATPIAQLFRKISRVNVGELPEGLFQGNFDKLTKLLKFQSEKLRQENLEIIQEDPVKQWVYETFYDKNKKAMQRKISVYIQNNRQAVETLGRVVKDITSIKKLRPYLEERYYSHIDEYQEEW